MNIAALRTQEDYARLSAPFDGVVTKRWSDPGDLAVPGKPIMSLEKISPYKVLAQVPQEELAGIARSSVVYLRANSETVKVAVHQVYPALGRNLQATIEVLVDATPFGVPSGGTVGFDVVATRAEGLVVPETALVQSSRGPLVYQIQDGVIRIQAVQVLGRGDGKVVIAGSLAPGNRVAIGQENRLLVLTEGSAVQVVEVPQ